MDSALDSFDINSGRRQNLCAFIGEKVIVALNRRSSVEKLTGFHASPHPEFAYFLVSSEIEPWY
jgi:hypothetical protein